jgi:hypothetical protein
VLGTRTTSRYHHTLSPTPTRNQVGLETHTRLEPMVCFFLLLIFILPTFVYLDCHHNHHPNSTQRHLRDVVRRTTSGYVLLVYSFFYLTVPVSLFFFSLLMMYFLYRFTLRSLRYSLPTITMNDRLGSRRICVSSHV